MPLAYFDNAASTKVDPRVSEAMFPYFCEKYANPSALHAPAQECRNAIEEARERIAQLLGAEDASEILFTSGATEGNNTVLNSFSGKYLVSAIEHPSVRGAALCTGRATLIPVDCKGTLDFVAYAELLKTVKPELVSVMLVNNEIGSIQDLQRIGEMAHAAGAKFHSDITQGVGKGKINLSELPIDYATLSGHKIHAPKGIGALWVKTDAPLKQFMVGGTHEYGCRAGTSNTPAIVALGTAAKIMIDEGATEAQKMREQRSRIISALKPQIPDMRINGQENGAPHIISMSFRQTEGESVIINLDAEGICCTAGSACSSGKKRSSPVLEAIGLTDDWLRGTVRVSLSRFTTDGEVDHLISSMVKSVEAVRNLGGYAVG